jgi:hypothetical protein
MLSEVSLAKASDFIVLIFAAILAWHEGIGADDVVFLQTTETADPFAGCAISTPDTQCIYVPLACS